MEQNPQQKEGGLPLHVLYVKTEPGREFVQGDDADLADGLYYIPEGHRVLLAFDGVAEWFLSYNHAVWWLDTFNDEERRPKDIPQEDAYAVLVGVLGAFWGASSDIEAEQWLSRGAFELFLQLPEEDYSVRPGTFWLSQQAATILNLQEPDEEWPTYGIDEEDEALLKEHNRAKIAYSAMMLLAHALKDHNCLNRDMLAELAGQSRETIDSILQEVFDEWCVCVAEYEEHAKSEKEA